jgi:hypothetical protein
LQRFKVTLRYFVQRGNEILLCCTGGRIQFLLRVRKIGLYFNTGENRVGAIDFAHNRALRIPEKSFF